MSPWLQAAIGLGIVVATVLMLVAVWRVVTMALDELAGRRRERHHVRRDERWVSTD